MTSIRITAAAALAALLLAGAGCGGEEEDLQYRAEKDLFDARKLAGELAFPNINRDFLERAVSAYRSIVEEYGDEAADEEMKMLVVAAQMELAELEFRAELFEPARDDFLEVLELADGIPEARANALWSAAYISSHIGDSAEAARLYSLFMERFLRPEAAAYTAGMNRRYLLTPIRLAEVSAALGDTAGRANALEKAVDLYRHILSSDPPPDLARETRYNLVTAFLLAGKWEDAIEAVRRMKKIYGDTRDLPGLMFLESRIMLSGFEDPGAAAGILDRIAREHSGSREAPSALLMIGGIRMGRGDLDGAEEVYEQVVENYPESSDEIVEATWQLARIEEMRGEWLDASLYYKSLYTDFPTTLQGLEAPLHIAGHYRDAGEKEAAEAAYRRAEEHYEKLVSRQYSESIRILAEEYYVRTFAEQGRWEDAAGRLLTLPVRYPEYSRFREAYLMAAAIYETELGNSAKALEILETCATRYPGTALAETARREMNRIRGSN